MTGLAEALDVLVIGVRLPESDSKEEWTAPEDSITGVGIRLKEAL